MVKNNLRWKIFFLTSLQFFRNRVKEHNNVKTYRAVLHARELKRFRDMNQGIQQLPSGSHRHLSTIFDVGKMGNALRSCSSDSGLRQMWVVDVAVRKPSSCWPPFRWHTCSFYTRCVSWYRQFHGNNVSWPYPSIHPIHHSRQRRYISGLPSFSVCCYDCQWHIWRSLSFQVEFHKSSHRMLSGANQWDQLPTWGVVFGLNG